MKISGAIFRNKNIIINTVDEFNAIYKGKIITISTNHGFGKPVYEHLKRYNVDVKDIKTGMYDVQSYQDCHTMRDAIRFALLGACLIS